MLIVCTFMIIYNKVESGLHLLTYLINWPTEQSGCDPHMTHLWSTRWSFLFKSNVTYVCIIWKIFDMEQCHRYLHSWQNTKSFPCTDFLKMKSLDTTCFKSWFHIFSVFIRSKVYQMSTLFSKEHAYVISGSHPNNLVWGWDPLDPPKKWPFNWSRLSGLSDPLLTVNFTLHVWSELTTILNFSWNNQAST